jgi:hypothetical protein
MFYYHNYCVSGIYNKKINYLKNFYKKETFMSMVTNRPRFTDCPGPYPPFSELEGISDIQGMGADNSSGATGPQSGAGSVILSIVSLVRTIFSQQISQLGPQPKSLNCSLTPHHIPCDYHLHVDEGAFIQTGPVSDMDPITTHNPSRGNGSCIIL